MTEGIEFTHDGREITPDQLFNMAYEAYLIDLENEADSYLDSVQPLTESDWETAHRAHLAALDELTAESQRMKLYD